MVFNFAFSPQIIRESVPRSLLSPFLDLEETDIILNALSKGTPIIKIILKFLSGLSKALWHFTSAS